MILTWTYCCIGVVHACSAARNSSPGGWIFVNESSRMTNFYLRFVSFHHLSCCPFIFHRHSAGEDTLQHTTNTKQSPGENENELFVNLPTKFDANEEDDDDDGELIAVSASGSSFAAIGRNSCCL